MRIIVNQRVPCSCGVSVCTAVEMLIFGVTQVVLLLAAYLWTRYVPESEVDFYGVPEDDDTAHNLDHHAHVPLGDHDDDRDAEHADSALRAGRHSSALELPVVTDSAAHGHTRV